MKGFAENNPQMLPTQYFCLSLAEMKKNMKVSLIFFVLWDLDTESLITTIKWLSKADVKWMNDLLL